MPSQKTHPSTSPRTLRGLLVAVGIGAAIGAALVLASIAVLARYLRAAAGGLGSGSDGFVRAYVLDLGAPMAAVYVAAGAACGAAAWWSVRRARGVAPATLGFWSGLGLASVLFSPTSAAALPHVRDWPFSVLVALGVGAAIAAGALARVHWRRYAVLHAALAAPLFVPAPAPRPPAAPRQGPGSVIVLGLDNLGRDGMTSLARRPVAAGPGARFLADAVAPAPLTRLVWEGIITGQSPATLIWMDTLTSAQRRAYYGAAPFLLTRRAARAGYRSSFITDDAATNAFTPGEAFDVVRADGIGWQVAARRLLGVTFPLYEGYVGRWRGVGVSNAPGGHGTWRVFRAVSRQLAEAGARPQLVAAHAVALHAVIRPTLAEAGGVRALLALRPSDLRADDPLSLRDGGTRAGPQSIPQPLLYERRRRQVLDETEAFLVRLDRAGYRQRHLIIVFTDHGELFLRHRERNLPGLHGVVLEPASLNVGVLVLLPALCGAGPARTVGGLFPVERISDLAARFMDAERRGTPCAGVLAALEPRDGAPAAPVYVRSAGRPALGDRDVYEGRQTFEASAMRPYVRLWPDGRVTVAPSGVALLDSTSDLGWSDGRSLIAYSRLAGGGVLVQCFTGQRLSGERRLGEGAGLPAANSAGAGCAPRGSPHHLD